MTPKQLAFAAAKMRGSRNADAATQAGYSARTATEAGARLARNPLILAAIAARRAAQGPCVRHTDPLDYLMATMADTGLDMRLRVEAAKALLPYTHPKAGTTRKKDAARAAALQASGKFAPAAVPIKLVPRQT